VQHRLQAGPGICIGDAGDLSFQDGRLLPIDDGDSRLKHTNSPWMAGTCRQVDRLRAASPGAGCLSDIGACGLTIALLGALKQKVVDLALQPSATVRP
jgi:hypothetical protein